MGLCNNSFPAHHRLAVQTLSWSCQRGLACDTQGCSEMLFFSTQTHIKWTSLLQSGKSNVLPYAPNLFLLQSNLSLSLSNQKLLICSFLIIFLFCSRGCEVFALKKKKINVFNHHLPLGKTFHQQQRHQKLWIVQQEVCQRHPCSSPCCCVTSTAQSSLQSKHAVARCAEHLLRPTKQKQQQKITE